MRIEHVAFSVSDPVAVAEWYVRHFGWQIRRHQAEPFHAFFLADSSGLVMVEIYNNPAAAAPDYRSMDPLLLHVGLACGADIEAVHGRLLEAGASDAGGLITTPSGDRLAMMRDPWGLAIQLCNRRKPI